MKLSDAIRLACQVHKDQVDKIGEPYILHPLRVMLSVEPNEQTRMVAVLHDCIEDGEITCADLKAMGYSSELCDILTLLTHKKDEPYEMYVQKLSQNPAARAVKIQDLRDNLDSQRLAKLDAETRSRLSQKYQPVLEYLLQLNDTK